MSPVLRVRIVRAPGANLPSEVILKLYDRRCLNNVREEYDPPAMWSAEKDRQYAQWMQDLADGKVQPTNVDEENFSIYRYHLFGGRLEDFLQYEATDLYNQELESYNALAEFQGDLIPRLYGAVTYRDPSRCTVPGILIEYVPGLTMRQLIATWTSHTPRLPDSELARACEAAVAVVKRLAHTDILNDDVRIDNLMFRDEVSGARSPVVVIDLTHCQLRGSLTDEEWATRKHGTDEIGAAGQILNQNVHEFVGPDVWDYYSGGHHWQPKP